MKLLELAIRDFKGIHDLKIDFGGRNMNIYGGNGTGKTTVYDAFLWLMFDRDSTGRHEFAAKPRGRNGEEIHHLKTRVEGRILHGDRMVALKKTLAEKWIKKRGESVRTYAGNETEYSLDGVPCSKGEYQAAIAKMIDEETFRMITSPGYFNAAASWQERRDKLFDLAGYLKGEDEMVALLPEFAGIRDTLRGRSTEEAKKSVQFSVKKLKEEMQGIPVRMDEIKRSMPNPAEWGELERMRDGARDKLEETERRLLSARELARAAAGRMKKAEAIRIRLKEREEEIRREAGKERREAKFELEDVLMQMSRAHRQILEANDQAKSAERAAASRRVEAASLQMEMDGAGCAAYMPPETSGLCALCGQALPEEMARKEEDERKMAFAKQKQRDTAALAARGEEIACRIQRLDAQAADASRRADETRTTIAVLEKRADELRAAAERKVPEIDPGMDGEYCLMASLLIKEEEKGPAEGDGDIQGLLDQKNKITDEIFCIEKKLAARAQFEAAQKRLAELSRELEKLLCEAGAKERMLADLEKFTAYKCSLMENKINSMFQTAKWKLFDLQINGGVCECCECMINGVPYADANSAARINTGLEIIDVFSKANGVSAPIFIDNRESIGEIFPVRSQVVNLVVTGEKALRAVPAARSDPPRTEADCP
jgi:hypothetical protein